MSIPDIFPEYQLFMISQLLLQVSCNELIDILNFHISEQTPDTNIGSIGVTPVKNRLAIPSNTSEKYGYTMFSNYVSCPIRRSDSSTSQIVPKIDIYLLNPSTYHYLNCLHSILHD